MDQCSHILGDGSTLVVAEDDCSLKCTVCHELVLELEPVALIFGPPDSAPCVHGNSPDCPTCKSLRTEDFRYFGHKG